MSQLRYEIETMPDLGVVNGNITSAQSRSNRNQAEAAIDWILEQEDTEAAMLLEDVDCSTPTKHGRGKRDKNAFLEFASNWVNLTEQMLSKAAIGTRPDLLPWMASAETLFLTMSLQNPFC